MPIPAAGGQCGWGASSPRGPDTSFEFTVPAQTKKILLDPYQTVLTRP